jgi:NAD dependent epimerase/dehydratase family enzyme
MLTSGQRVLPARLLSSGFGFACPELEPALRALLANPA